MTPENPTESPTDRPAAAAPTWVFVQVDRPSEPMPTSPSPRCLAAIADDRVKVRRQVTLDDGTIAWLQLARGTVLRPGDRLRTAEGDCCWVVAQPEPVLTVRSADLLALLQAAYHLGNRHAPLEIAIDYLRLAADPTLQDLLERRGLTVIAEIAPFVPDPGAYAQSDRPHSTSHAHDHAHHHHH